MVYLCHKAAMKKNILTIVVLFFLFFLFSCDKKNVSSCLMQAEKMMEMYPDSAYKLLQKVANPEKLPLEQQARYNLLYSMALIKNGIRPESDSLISEVISYYQSTADTASLSKAILYAGFTNYFLGATDKAILLFKKAADCTLPADFDQKSRAYRYIGYSYQHCNMSDSALTAHLKAIQYGNLSTNNRYRLSLLRDVARAYKNTNQQEKAIPFYFQVIDTLKLEANSLFLSGILNEISAVYADMGNFREALRYAREAKEKRISRDEVPVHNLALGRIYLNINNADSARCYLVKALQSTNHYVSNAAYRYLILLDEQVGDFEEAFNTFGKYTNSSSNIDQEIDNEIMRRRYEEEKLKNENNLLKLSKRERELYLLWLILFVLLTTIVAYMLYTREKKKRVLKEKLGEELLLKEKAKQLESENLLLKKDGELGMLREKDALLRESLFKRMTLSEKIPSLGMSPKDDQPDSGDRRIVLTEQDWQELVQTVNDAYDNFAVRLLTAYPSLNNNEIAFCCLLRIKITLKDLSDIYCISKASVAKKKSRMKKDKLGLNDNTLSLDEYLERF